MKKFFNSLKLIDKPDTTVEVQEVNQPIKRTYKIDFPGKVITDQKLIQVDSILIKYNIYTCADNKINYSLISSELPQFYLDNPPKSKVELRVFYDNFLKQYSAIDDNTPFFEDIYYKGLYGRSIKIHKQKENYTMVFRVFFYNKSLYLMGAITPPGKENNSELIDFFDSFEIIEE